MSQSDLSIKCMVVDDEQYARELLIHLVEKQPQLQLVASCKNAFEAKVALEDQRIDVIFLDIQMPHKTGLEFLEEYEIESKIVFTTAYQDFALKSYEFDVLDYLLKPILETRFIKCFEKIKNSFMLEEKAFQFESLQNDQTQYLVIKSGYDKHRLKLSEIELIESVGEYIRYYTKERKFLVLNSLTKMENELPESFIRTHRSFIVPKQKIKSKSGHTLTMNNGMKVPVGKTYRTKISNTDLFK